MSAREGLGLHVGRAKATIKKGTGRTWVTLPPEAEWCIASFIVCYSNWEPMGVNVANSLILKRGFKLTVCDGVTLENKDLGVFIERNSNSYDDDDYFIINILYSTGGVEEWNPYS
jgi:hypothetical protein